MTDEYAIPGQENQPERPKFADLFRKMADAIERNEGSTFGGAVVVVPPFGTPLDILILNSQKDAGQFWGTVDAAVKAALADVEEQSRNIQAHRR